MVCTLANSHPVGDFVGLSFVYNVLLVRSFQPFFGILLNPMWAAAAMSLSSVSVGSNLLRLRGFRG